MAFDFKNFGSTTKEEEKKKQTTKSGTFDFNSFGTSTPIKQVPQTQTKDQESAQNYGASFPAVTGENPLRAGFKSLGNVPSSAINFGKSIGTALFNPIDTAKGIAGTAAGGVQKLIPGTQKQEQQFNQFASFLKDRYGSLENLQRTATNDPFGFGTDVISLVAGGAGVAGKTAQLDKAISTTSKVVTKPIAKTTNAVGSGIDKTTKFGISQATGLNPDTISNIIANPKAFSKEALSDTTRTGLGAEVKTAIDTKIDDLSDIGKGYDTIKQTEGVVSIPEGTAEQILNKYGIQVVDGKVKTTAEALPLTSADKTALEDFLNVYGNEPQLSNNAFLNTRSALSQLSKYDAAKTGNLTPIVRDLRGAYDNLGKTQIKGLAELDAKYAPEVKALKQIKKDYLQRDGSFKDGAVNKIANLTGAGKEQVLGRLESVMPGVGQRIKILKAAEDLERASGLKVGTYARTALAGGGLATGNIPAVITAIIASPEIAVRLLKAYGYTKNTSRPIVEMLYSMGNDINNFRLPGGLQNYVEDYLKDNNYIKDATQGVSDQVILKSKQPNIETSLNATTKKPFDKTKQGGFVRIGKETPKTVQPKSKVSESVSSTNSSTSKQLIKEVDDKIALEIDEIVEKAYKTEGKNFNLEDIAELERIQELIRKNKPLTPDDRLSFYEITKRKKLI